MMPNICLMMSVSKEKLRCAKYASRFGWRPSRLIILTGTDHENQATCGSRETNAGSAMNPSQVDWARTISAVPGEGRLPLPGEQAVRMHAITI